MKKVLYFATLFLGFTFTACEKEDIENTATVDTAGEWYVTVDAVDENGAQVYSDDNLYKLGKIHLITYNTSANNPNEMIVDDLGNFWEFKVKVNVNQDALTFSTSTTANNNLVKGYESINVSISGGKILPKAGRQNNGSPADSIVFYVNFSDDLTDTGTPTPEAYGFAKYRVSGIRYSGLAEND